MKKILLLSTLMTGSLIFAQTSANVNVTIRLHDVQTITVNNGVNNVILDYYTQSDYENGVSSQQNNHIAAFSTSDYFVKTKVLQDNIITTNDVYLNGIQQTLNAQTLFSNGAGNHLYDVTYKAKGNYEYLTKAKTNYTVQVVYSIEPQ